MEVKFKDNNKDMFKRGNDRGPIGFAVLLIIIGGIFLLFNLNIIPEIYKPLFMKWQTLVIAIGLWMLLKRNFAAGIILMGVGFVFLYPTLCAIFPDQFRYIDIDFRTYWPVILIFVGAILVIQWLIPSRNKRTKIEYTEYNSSDRYGNSAAMHNTDFIDKNVMFGSSEQIILSNNFKGGDANVMFGELIIDLRRANLAEGTYKLELNAMFGSVVVYVSPEWNIDVKANSVLGSFEDKRHQGSLTTNNISTLVIKGSAIFGSGEIRN